VEQARLVDEPDNIERNRELLSHLQARSAKELNDLMPAILAKAFTGEIMTRMPVPLCRGQIDAACRLHGELAFWRSADNALEALAQKFPGFRHEAVLLKVVTINSLYYTNVYAVPRMAQQVESVMAKVEPGSTGLDVVDLIADLPMTPSQKSPRKFPSFASKFAHFFIDAERFPIFDSYAEMVIRLHLGANGCNIDKQHPYAAYVANFQNLRQMAGWTGTARGLDRYLWIAGQYRVFLHKQNAQINSELRKLFEHPPPSIKRDLGLLLGDSSGKLIGHTSPRSKAIGV
jgi:hypothetical protein